MAHSRNIKPSFFIDESMMELSFQGRLLFIGLWCLADREGRLDDKPKQIKVQVFPSDNVDVAQELDILEKLNVIERYAVEGKNYIKINNFLKHQSPHPKEAKSKIPDSEDELQEVTCNEIDLSDSAAKLSLNLESGILNPESGISLHADAEEKVDDAPFEEFWVQYPKQRAGSKQKAWNAWKYAVKRTKALPSEIIAGCLAYSASEEVSNGFAKGCAAWLNDDRWRHDYSKMTVTNQKPTYSDTMQRAAEIAIRGIQSASSC